MGTILITDTSVLLNLVASGAADEIFSGCGMEFQVCPDVVAETKVLRDRETGEEHIINLEPWLSAGLLRQVEPETDAEYVLLVDYSALLGAGDGEAMCFALAEARNLTVAIDDERAVRRARRRNPNFETVCTLEILNRWQDRSAISNERMGQLLQTIFQFARYRPPESHPQFAWWQKCWPGK